MSHDHNAARQSEARRKERQINRRSTVMILMGMAVFIGLSWMILGQVYGPAEELRDRIQLVAKLKLKLEALRETDHGLELLREPPHPGDVLHFQVSSSQPLHAAMALSVNNGPPGVVFDYTRIPPGEDRPIQHWDEHYRYQISSADKQLRFCLLHQADSQQLQAEIAMLDKVWPRLPARDCVQLNPI